MELSKDSKTDALEATLKPKDAKTRIAVGPLDQS